MIDLKNGYTYSDLQADLKRLRVPHYEIGKSTEGRSIYAFRLGTGKNHVLYNGAHHGLEWLTPPLLMQFAFDYLDALKQNRRLATFNINELCQKTTIHIVPMLNPDGIEIAARGSKRKDLILMNRGADFCKNWQSNARGVDLNHNYDAGFSICKKQEYALGITGPGPTRYGGKAPESEPETRALCDYVRQNDFKLCLAYHSQGEVIYYDYNGVVPENGAEICRELCALSGYLPDKAEGIASYGGFKDWFIETYRRPAYTIEIGHGKNPLPFCQFSEIYEKNLKMLIMAAFLC